MNLDALLKTTCDDWAAEVQVPVGLADRALRRRTRRRSLKVSFAAGSTALIIGAAAIAFSVNDSPRRSPQPPIDQVQMSSDTTVHTDLSNSFPRSLVAAGHTAIAAYYTGKLMPSAKKPKTFERTWFLYNPTSGTYEKTRWAFLDVAPGMHQAAVLEGPLPTTRVGILDLKTQKVTRWVSVAHPVGGVAWAPDGRRLLLTAYAKNPDRVYVPSTRTGFSIMDARSAPGTFHAVAADPDNMNYRQDFGWSRSGTLIWAPTVSDPAKNFYGLDGRPQPAPAHEAEAGEEAGLSPNGQLQATSGPRPGPAVTIKNVKTGQQVAILPVLQAQAWADDQQLFALGCSTKECKGRDEFRNQLILVGLDGKVTPLTGFRQSDQPGTWWPVFTHR